MEHVDSGEDTPPAAATPTAVKKAPALEPEAPPTQPATEEDGKKKKKKHHKDKDSEHKSEKKDKKKRKKVCVLCEGGRRDGCVWKCKEQHRGDCHAVDDAAVGCMGLRQCISLTLTSRTRSRRCQVSVDPGGALPCSQPRFRSLQHGSASTTPVLRALTTFLALRLQEMCIDWNLAGRTATVRLCPASTLTVNPIKTDHYDTATCNLRPDTRDWDAAEACAWKKGLRRSGHPTGALARMPPGLKGVTTCVPSSATPAFARSGGLGAKRPCDV